MFELSMSAHCIKKEISAHIKQTNSNSHFQQTPSQDEWEMPNNKPTILATLESVHDTTIHDTLTMMAIAPNKMEISKSVFCFYYCSNKPDS